MSKSKPLPDNEDQRLERLKSYIILDTLPEKQFDDITRLASIICDTPITLINLIDENRQWFKSIIGFDLQDVPREISFCRYAIMGDDIFEVENSLDDERFAKNPLVTGNPNIRFYAGAPLRTAEGFNMGTLCVIDTKPKKLNQDQREALTILANEVINKLELRKERNKAEGEKQTVPRSNNLMHDFFENSPAIITTKYTDLGYMKEFSEGRSSFVKEMIRIFLEQTPLDIAAIDKGLKENSFQQIRTIAHSLQTSLAFIGFPAALIASLKEVEMLAIQEQQFGLIREKLNTIVAGCIKAQEELKEELQLMK